MRRRLLAWIELQWANLTLFWPCWLRRRHANATKHVSHPEREPRLESDHLVIRIRLRCPDCGLGAGSMLIVDPEILTASPELRRMIDAELEAAFQRMRQRAWYGS